MLAWLSQGSLVAPKQSRTDENECSHRGTMEQGARGHLKFLDHQNCRNDARRDWRRFGYHDAELGLPSLYGNLHFGADSIGHVPNRREEVYPFLYWATIVASTTFGTTMADFADRSLGIGYTGGSTLLFLCLTAVLGLWYWSEGTISVNTVTTPKVEAIYWTAI